MSPLSDGPCPRLRYVPSPDGKDAPPIALCSDYAHRPQQCRDHGFDFARFCPVGFDFLKDSFRCAQDVARRIDDAYNLAKDLP